MARRWHRSNLMAWVLWATLGALRAGEPEYTKLRINEIISNNRTVGPTNCNCNRVLDIADPVLILSYLFLGGRAPPEPFSACGVRLQDGLPCDSFPTCM